MVYQVLSRHAEYVELGGDYYDQRSKPKVVARLVTRLTKLGYQVDLKPVEAIREPTTVVRQPQQEAERVPESTGLANPACADAIYPKRKRGRPCKCAARGIICRHGTSSNVNSMTSQTLQAGEFS